MTERTSASDLLVADLRHMCAMWDEPPARVLLRSLPRVVTQGRFRTVVWFRLSQAAYARSTPLGAWMQSRGQRASGAELHPAAQIGGGFNLMHGGGVVVGHEVVAGEGLALYQGVTLGHGRDGVGQPTLGDRVRLYAGAVVLGPVTIGDDVKIGAQALVLGDVADGETVTGVRRAGGPRTG